MIYITPVLEQSGHVCLFFKLAGTINILVCLKDSIKYTH